MRKKLTFDDYVDYIDKVAVRQCTFVIKRYFGSRVSEFYKSASEFNDWFDKPQEERKVIADTVWANIRHFNFAGIKQKYIRSIFGNNYDSAEWMGRMKVTLKSMGYNIKPHGTLFYKGERHYYPTKYLPPQKRLEELFKDKDKVDAILDRGNYDRKIRDILDAMVKEVSPDYEGSMCWQELVKLVKEQLNSFMIGPPSTFKNLLTTILTEYKYKELEKYWKNRSGDPRMQRFLGNGWLELLSQYEKVELYRARLDFLNNLNKQLDGPLAFRMFKDEYVRGRRGVKSHFVPVTDERIIRARSIVQKGIRMYEEALAKLQVESVTNE